MQKLTLQQNRDFSVMIMLSWHVIILSKLSNYHQHYHQHIERVSNGGDKSGGGTDCFWRKAFPRKNAKYPLTFIRCWCWWWWWWWWCWCIQEHYCHLGLCTFFQPHDAETPPHSITIATINSIIITAITIAIITIATIIITVTIIVIIVIIIAGQSAKQPLRHEGGGYLWPIL